MTLQDLPTVNKILIRVKRQSRSSGRRQARQQEFLAGNFSDNKYVVDSTTEIGPKVGGKLRADAAMAIGVAVLGILAYVAFRFKFNFEWARQSRHSMTCLQS